MMHATIDMTGLPDALAIALKEQMEAMVEKAKADLPIGFEQRVELALAELPYEDVKNIKMPMLVSSFKLHLQQHFDALGFIDVISEKASSCIDWSIEQFDDAEFEHQLAKALERFFM